MLIHPWDASSDPKEWQDFTRSQGFGHFVAAGRGREVPVVVPTQFVLTEDAGEVLLHFARPNPVWPALEENPTALLSIAGDWAYIPTTWKAIGDEDPAMGVPTTYYASAQLTGRADIVDDADGKLAILRALLAHLEPGSGHVDPAEHARLLPGIRGIRMVISDVKAKFKYGGNVDDAHRAAVAAHLGQRSGPGDASALSHLTRRS